MTVEQAKKIGATEALKAVAVGLVLAQIIMTLLSVESGLVNAFLWFLDFDYGLNLVIGAIIMVVCGYFFGQFAGVAILIKKGDYSWIGVKYGMLTLLTTAFLASWLGFFQEGINHLGSGDDPFYDYIFKPLFWISVFGLLPVVLVGIWFGKKIKTRGKLVS